MSYCNSSPLHCKYNLYMYMSVYLDKNYIIWFVQWFIYPTYFHFQRYFDSRFVDMLFQPCNSLKIPQRMFLGGYRFQNEKLLRIKRTLNYDCPYVLVAHFILNMSNKRKHELCKWQHVNCWFTKHYRFSFSRFRALGASASSLKIKYHGILFIPGRILNRMIVINYK